MPDTGAPWSIPYPLKTDKPDDPTQSEARARQIHADLNTLQTSVNALQASLDTAKTTIPNVQTGPLGITGTNVSSATGSATFNRAFPSAPIVVVNLAASAGTSKVWAARAIVVSVTAVTGWLFTSDGSVATSLATTLGYIAALGSSVGPTRDARAAEGWHEVTGTCHTPGCPKEDEAVPHIYVPDDPIEWGWSGVTCGGCGVEITDLTEEMS